VHDSEVELRDSFIFPDCLNAFRENSQYPSLNDQQQATEAQTKKKGRRGKKKSKTK
jgi:hypothetical protein